MSTEVGECVLMRNARKDDLPRIFEIFRGEQWDFRICPLRQHLREQAVWKARAVPARLRALFGRLPVLSRAPEGNDEITTQPPGSAQHGVWGSCSSAFTDRRCFRGPG